MVSHSACQFAVWQSKCKYFLADTFNFQAKLFIIIIISLISNFYNQSQCQNHFSHDGAFSEFHICNHICINLFVRKLCISHLHLMVVVFIPLKRTLKYCQLCLKNSLPCVSTVTVI